MGIIRKIVVIVAMIVAVTAISNGLALTPPLVFAQGSCLSDGGSVMKQADLLLSTGLASKGYKYMLIGPGWQSERDKSGRIKENTNKFPSGMQDLIAQLHSKGLLVGLTTDIGLKTACGVPGSSGYEQIDATTYASWGVDYIKIENSQNVVGARSRMTIFSSFIIETGRRILIEIDNAGQEGVENWGAQIANTWSTGSMLKPTWESMVSGLNKQIGLEKYAGEGAWNNAGSLLTDLPLSELVSQYCAWICLKSPLTISAQLESLSQEKLKVLLNPQLLSLHQDSLKLQGKLILREDYTKGWQQTWGVALSNKRYLLIFLNGMSEPSKMQVSLKQDLHISVTSYWIRDPLSQSTSGSSSSDLLTVEKVAAHGVEARVINL